MNAKVTSQALMMALVCHAIIAIVVGIYLLGQTSEFKDLIGIEILQPKKRPKPKVATYVVKPDAKPTVPLQNIVLEQIQVQSRVETIFRREPRLQPQTALKFSRQTVKVKPPIDSNVPKVVALTPRVPTSVIHGDLLVLDAPEALAFSAPVVTAPSARMRNVSRGIAGQLQVPLEHPPGLAMVESVGAAAVVRSRDLLGNKYGAGRIDGRFSENEAAGLRRYLVEKGGFLVFDDCGTNAPAQAMVRLFLAQMRYVMPEYHVERISNNHEVYNNFYGMGGPPIGYDIFWWVHVHRNGVISKAAPSVNNSPLSLSVVTTCVQWKPSVSQHGVFTIRRVSFVS